MRTKGITLNELSDCHTAWTGWPNQWGHLRLIGPINFAGFYGHANTSHPTRRIRDIWRVNNGRHADGQNTKIGMAIIRSSFNRLRT